MRTKTGTILISAVIVVAGIGMSGCAGIPANAGEGISGDEVHAPSRAQVDALADGVVDRAEYEAGFAAFQACMAAGGYTVEVLDATSTVIDYRYLAAATDDGTDAPCYEVEFKDVDEAWQGAHQEELTDGPLIDACLRANDLPIPKTRQEKIDALVTASVDLGTCLGDD